MVQAIALAGRLVGVVIMSTNVLASSQALLILRSVAAAGCASPTAVSCISMMASLEYRVLNSLRALRSTAQKLYVIQVSPWPSPSTMRNACQRPLPTLILTSWPPGFQSIALQFLASRS